MPVKECEDFISNYFSRFPAVKKWVTGIKKYASRNKCVKSLTGRIRHLPAVDSSERSIANEALRQAVNAPIQCLNVDTPIMTQHGYIPLHQMDTEEYVKVWDGYAWRMGRRQPQISRKEGVKIHTQYLGQLELSADHPVRVANDQGFFWKLAGDLTPEDYLVNTVAFSENGCDDIAGVLEESGRKKGLTFPTHLTEDLGYVIGCLLGNGSYSNPDGTMSFCTPDDTVSSLFKNSMKKLFNLGIDYQDKLYQGEFSYHRSCGLSSTDIRRFFSLVGLGFHTAADKEIPISILGASPSVRVGLLKGLFDTDGACTGSPSAGYEISYKSASKGLVHQVSLLLGSLGIFSRIYCNTEKGQSGTYYRCAVDISSASEFSKLIGFRFVPRKERLQECLANIKLRKVRDYIPKAISISIGNTVFNSEKYKSSIKGGQLKADVCNSRSPSKRVSRQVALDLVERFHLEEFKYLKGMKFHKVTRLEHTGMQDMMDLEVLSDFHGFTASNFIVHNCTGSDCTLMSLILINKWLKETGKRSVIFITVHDSIGVDCPKDELVEVCQKVKHIMENLALYNPKYKFLGDVPIVSECEIGYSYGESFELDDFDAAMKRITEEGVDVILQEFLDKKHKKEEEAFQKAIDNGEVIPRYVEGYWKGR